jgi:hypothetical protein
MIMEFWSLWTAQAAIARAIGRRTACAEGVLAVSVAGFAGLKLTDIVDRWGLSLLRRPV